MLVSLKCSICGRTQNYDFPDIDKKGLLENFLRDDFICSECRKLDEIDVLLLTVLQMEGDMSSNRLAKVFGLSVEEVKTRLDYLTRTNIITKYDGI